MTVKRDESLTKEQALKLAASRFWEKMTPREVATFQINEKLLCMPFDIFHKALEETLGRPVWTHELGLNWEGIQAEINGEKGPPTMQEILDLIPEDKRIVVVT